MIIDRRMIFPIALIIALMSSAQLTRAQSEAETTTEEPRPVVVPDSLSNPRATMQTFLEAMNAASGGSSDRVEDAITALDLSQVNQIIRNDRSRDLAWMLFEVIGTTRDVDLAQIPDNREGKPYLFHSYVQGDVTINRNPEGFWLFSQETVDKLPQIMDELSRNEQLEGAQAVSEYLPWHLRLRQLMPASLKQETFYLQNWQWIGLFLTILIGVILDKFFTFSLRGVVRRWRLSASDGEFQDISEDILRPLGLMVMAVFWWVSINLMGLPESAMVILLLAVKFLASISGVWTAYRLVDLVSAYLMRKAKQTDNKLDDALVPLVPRTLKIFVTVIGFVFIADNLNIDISSLLAGLGLGGLAFALAAKDMVQNLFGSVTVLMDRTFTVGDWVVVDGSEGTVERIGFRSTRIRTFYNSVVTVPNSKFITATVDNMGERRYRRLSCKLSLTYDTPPDRIEAFCEGVRELVRQHPYMRKDYYQVYLNEFAGSSLDVLLYVFWETPEWNTELRERHRFMLDILRLAQRMGVEFAFPTQTLYMKPEESETTEMKEMRQKEALDLGKETAREIVAETTGLGVRPPPVVFPPVDRD